MVGAAVLAVLLMLAPASVAGFTPGQATSAFSASQSATGTSSLGVRIRDANKLQVNPFTRRTGVKPIATQLMAKSTDDQTEKRRGPVVNLGLVRQTLLNQILIGSTIWTGGAGAQALAKSATFGPTSLLFGIAGFVPLFLFSRRIETSESSAVADLNLSTNMLVLRLFGDKPQPLVAFGVSALLGAVTGLVEETTFRGQLLPILSAKFDSLPVGCLLSTLLFAALHVNPLSLFNNRGEGFKDALVLVVYQLVTGSIFATLFLLTNNLAVPIIAHSLYDCYVFLAAHLQVTTQMEYARKESLMPVAPSSTEAKWRQKRGDRFLLGARESFFLADINRDGVLSREEVRIALYSYGVRLTAEESARVTQAADTDQSGTVSFSEFLEFVGPSGDPGKAIKSSLLGVK